MSATPGANNWLWAAADGKYAIAERVSTCLTFLRSAQ
jgi:hypothetical protein